MTTSDIATQLVDLCRRGEDQKAVETLYARDIESVEPFDMPQMPRKIKGLDAVRKKEQWWYDNNIVNGVKVGDPFVADDKFAVPFEYDITSKATKTNQHMSEVGVYTVAGDKIIREEFLYAAT